MRHAHRHPQTREEMIIDLQSDDRWQAIEELIDQLVIEGKILPEHRPSVIEAVNKRERSMSTGIGFGIAIPHASTELVAEVIEVKGRSKTGIDFGALDGKPVHRVILFLVPAGQFQKHAHILADIAKQLHKMDF
ncbi:MAG: PTS sugar transporter subunit IIA [Verrucomicrobiae bacterium]|nr:PTS sugar transporter subunit IIA [Verrucomicrobiae bacterium]